MKKNTKSVRQLIWNFAVLFSLLVGLHSNHQVLNQYGMNGTKSEGWIFSENTVFHEINEKVYNLHVASIFTGNQVCMTSLDMKIIKWTTNTIMVSSTIQNSRIRALNGNISNQISLIHWNMGSKHWSKKKLEMEAVIQKYKPDIFSISEANMLVDLPDFEKNLVGYQVHTPPVPREHKMIRIVLLVKDGLTVEILNNFMDPKIAAIWCKIGSRGRKPMTICMAYREHQYILVENDNNSLSPACQLARWRCFINIWKQAAANTDVIVMGDLNIDFAKWNNNDNSNWRLIQIMKDEIETMGFSQQIETETRSWKGQSSSILDHIWSNSPGRLIFSKNVKRSFSDHNLLWTQFRTKEKVKIKHNFWKREGNIWIWIDTN